MPLFPQVNNSEVGAGTSGGGCNIYNVREAMIASKKFIKHSLRAETPLFAGARGKIYARSRWRKRRWRRRNEYLRFAISNERRPPRNIDKYKFLSRWNHNERQYLNVQNANVSTIYCSARIFIVCMRWLKFIEQFLQANKNLRIFMDFSIVEGILSKVRCVLDMFEENLFTFQVIPALCTPWYR